MTRETPKAKRSRMKGQERRELILARAKHVFAEHSYPNASTGILAQESEVTEPVLYKHFGSKKGLFLEVLHTYGKRFMQTWQERLDRRAKESVLDALSHAMLDYKAVIMADDDLHRVFFQAIAESSDPDIAACVSWHNQQIFTSIYQLLEQAQREGLLLPEIELNATCWGYMSMVFAMQYSQMLDLHRKFDLETLKEMNRLWLRAVRP